MDIDDVIKFLCDHNIRSIEINQDKNEATITERHGSITTFEINTDCDHDIDICECEAYPCSCAKCTYCGDRPCVC